MTRTYFTYGCEGFPFVFGWTEVIAPDEEKTCEGFRRFHKDVHKGLLNCAGVYSEDQFSRTEMYVKGNLGKRCHEIIVWDGEDDDYKRYLL